MFGLRQCSRILLVCVTLLALGAQAEGNHLLPRKPEGQAPSQGMVNGSWTSGVKDIFGTSFEAYDKDMGYSDTSVTAPISKVWFTGSKGVLTEVYWPTIDTKQMRDAELLITDGKTFFFEEKKDSDTSIEWVAPGVPAYKIINRDPRGRFQIEKLVFTDPERDVLITRYRIIKNIEGLRFFFLHNPAVANTSLGDNARVAMGDMAPGEGLYAWEGDSAQAVLFSVPLNQASAGFEAANDGYQDLSRDLSMDSSFEKALNGNVVNTAWIGIPESVGISEFDVAIGFGHSIEKAHDIAKASLADVTHAQTLYQSEWKAYQASVKNLDQDATDGGKLYRASVAVLKSMEDKTYPGAFVASPTIPWGQFRNEKGFDLIGARSTAGGPRSDQIAGYHLVWPRDLYQMATTFLAIDDPKPAIASLNYYRRIQYGANSGVWDFGMRSHSKEGSFLQNCWVNGEAYWTELQIDQSSFPIMLAHRLWGEKRIELADYWPMVQKAADFISAVGPWSRQERWEENFGVSPSNVAAEISALWGAAEMAHAMNDEGRAKSYTAIADAWSSKPNDNIESWTFTETGGLGNGKYYERVEAGNNFDQLWDPNDNAYFYIQNGGGYQREKDIVDGGFLELVRYGVRSAVDYHVLETMHEYDQYDRVDTSKGPGFYRYTGDRYNYDDQTGAATRGMLWPFLTGERGHYEIARAVETGASVEQVRASAVPYIQAMEQFATPSLMLPEQVWDSGARQGLPTGAATPLGWTHGEYIKLLSSRHDGVVTDSLTGIYRRARMLNSLDWSEIEKLHQ